METERESDSQIEIRSEGTSRVVAIASAYHADERNRESDILVTGSYMGVLPARFVAIHRPRAVIGVDCAIALDGSGIAGLWYYEALGIPAASADVMSVILGNGLDVYENGVISRTNYSAASCGVEAGMTVEAGVQLLLQKRPKLASPLAITNRVVVATLSSGRQIVCTDSIAFGLPEDRDNVLCTAGHTGRSALPYLRAVRPHGFICSDGGRGRNDSGVAGLFEVEKDGIAGATVDSRTARMGDGLSTYGDGRISARNKLAGERGVEIGMAASSAARLLGES